MDVVHRLLLGGSQLFPTSRWFIVSYLEVAYCFLPGGSPLFPTLSLLTVSYLEMVHCFLKLLLLPLQQVVCVIKLPLK